MNKWKICAILFTIMVFLITCNVTEGMEIPPTNCEKALEDLCYEDRSDINKCKVCAGNNQHKLRQANCTNDDIDLYCSPLKLKDGVNKDNLLSKVTAAYNDTTGNGVLVSFIDLDGGGGPSHYPLMDGSGSIIRKDIGADIWPWGHIGYIWDPDDNLDVSECTYPVDAATTERHDKDGKFDRCGGLTSKLKPILCETTPPPTNNCIQKMITERKTKDKHDSWSEVVILRNLKNNTSYLDILFNNSLRKLPSAFVLMFEENTADWKPPTCLERDLWGDAGLIEKVTKGFDPTSLCVIAHKVISSKEVIFHEIRELKDVFCTPSSV